MTDKVVRGESLADVEVGEEGLQAEAWVFDMFSTLVEMVKPPEHIERMAAFMKTDSEHLRAAVEEIHSEYEVGLTSIQAQRERMQELARRLGVRGVRASRLAARRLLKIEADAFTEATRLYETVPDTLARLRRVGRKVAICSNVSYVGLHVANYHGLPDMVDYAAFSCLEGVKKPDSEIYEKVSRELGIRPIDTLYFDDNPECVTGAERIGMHGVLVLHRDGTAAGMPGVEDEYAYIPGIHDVDTLI